MKLMFLVFGATVLMFNLAYAQGETHHGQQHASGQQHVNAEPVKDKFCPVCGPEEEMEALSVSYKYKGKKYSFCSMDCMKAFKNNPEQYTK